MATFRINEKDITYDVLLNSFNYMKRIDDVFGTGSFKFESNFFTDNIPPYSVLKIDDEYFLCGSEATYHYGASKWFHTVNMIEATSVLSRFLVGTKAFSVTGRNTEDYEKIRILIDLVNQKYGVNINFDFESAWGIFTKMIEYVFTAGTTLFDALNEIFKNYNYKVYVSRIEGNNIDIEYRELSGLTAQTLDENKVLSKTKLQNAETYCKYLETEANNVIDTTNTTIVDNLFPSAGDIKLNEDTYLLKLPTPVYKVNQFWVNMSGVLETYLTMEEDIAEEPITKTYEEWCVDFPALREIYERYYKEFVPSWDDFKIVPWVNDGKDLGPYGENLPNEIRKNLKVKVDLTNRIKSKEEYDLIKDKDKPDYVYYTLGSNVIDGFNIYYKNDFWNTIISERNSPFMYELGFEKDYHQNASYGGIKISLFRITANSAIFERTYGVRYYSLSNPYMVNTKNDLPLNEDEYKPYALSYGKSSNYVDFDKLNNSLKIENYSIGKPEMVVEYDITNESLLNEYTKVSFNNETWYVSNAQYRLTPNQRLVTFNLVKNYNKVADVISLNSQYNTTRNPLQDIVERPIFIETNTNFTFTQGISYLLVEFKYEVGDSKKLLFAPIVLQDNNDVYLYFEMQDQYSAGDNRIKINATQFKVEGIPYVDTFNEVKEINIKKIDLKQIEPEMARQLPKLTNEFINNHTFEDIEDSILVFKDSREKLTFTIKANNCIIR